MMLVPGYKDLPSVNLCMSSDVSTRTSPWYHSRILKDKCHGLGLGFEDLACWPCPGQGLGLSLANCCYCLW